MSWSDWMISLLPARIRDMVSGGAERSREAVKNIVISLCTKCVTIIVQLLIIPLTISYVSPSKFGIWTTLSSVIAWVAFFDLGLGNGFRNRFAEAKAKDDMTLAHQYVSTTYFAVTMVISVAFLGLMIANRYVNWGVVLGLPGADAEELRQVFAVLCSFFCLSMVVNNFTALLTADQKPGLAAAVNAGGQTCALAAVWVLTLCSDEGSMVNLAICLSGVPCLFTAIVSILCFTGSRYRTFAPSLSTVRPVLIRNILGLGVNFFLIYICMLVVFQLMQLALIREVGPDAVTQYYISNRYFNVMYSLVLIVITPFWSAFTDAYTKKDFEWMRRVIRKLEIVWMFSIIAGLIMLALSPLAYKILSKEQVTVPLGLSLAVMGYTFIQTIANIYMYLINGIGTVRLQLLIYLFMAVVTWPMMVWCCRHFGACGVLVPPGLAFLFQALAGRIQLERLMSGTARGLWCK